MQKKGGWGIVYQEVMRNSNLSVEAKAIYAYLSSIAGVGGFCYPSLNTIQKDMAMSRNRVSKYLNQLIHMGIVEKTRERTATGFGTNVYKVTHEAKVSEELQDIFRAIESGQDTVFVENVVLQNEALGSEALQNIDTNNNNTNNNNTNNNKINKNSIKGKASKSVKVYFPDDELLNQAFADYVEMRKQIKKPMTDRAVTLAIKKLQELSEIPFNGTMDNELAIQILNQSIMNSWLSLYPLNEDRKRKKGEEAVGNKNQSRGQAADFYEQFLGTGNSN